MNEETTTPETAVELDTDIVKETLVDSTLNTEYDIKTPYVTRTVNVELLPPPCSACKTSSRSSVRAFNPEIHAAGGGHRLLYGPLRP